MKKIISVLAAAGVIAALSIPAFASEGRPASKAPAKLETAVTTLGEGINSDTTAADETLDNKDSEHRGVTLVEDGGEYVAELGESLSTTDTAKDPVL